jgi:hypothetical protein
MLDTSKRRPLRFARAQLSQSIASAQPELPMATQSSMTFTSSVTNSYTSQCTAGGDTQANAGCTVKQQTFQKQTMQTASRVIAATT